MRSSVFTIGLLIALSTSLSAKSYFEFLDAWTGRWEGEFTVRKEQDRIVRIFRIEQTYWWEGDEQRAVAVYANGAGNSSIHFSESRIYFKDGQLFSQTSYSNGTTRLFRGEIHGSSILWRPLNPKSGSTRLTSERIENPNTPQAALHAYGLEKQHSPQGETTFKLQGLLHRQNDPEEPSPSPQNDTESMLPARP